MIREALVTILFPAVLFFWAAPLVSRLSFYKGLNLLEKGVLIGAASSSIFVILASWGAVLGSGLVKQLLGALFLFTLVLFLYWTISLARDKPKVRLPRISASEKIILVVILVIVLKAFVLASLRPIVDPDVIVSHLPFARTIVEENLVPAQDKYTLNPMTIPPIGGPILYATTYVLSGSIFSESFRLLTLPFLIGLAILAYLIGNRISGRLFGLVAALIFLSLPWIDTLLLEWLVYPELIFAFLGLSLFYFLEFHFFNVPHKSNRELGVFFGLILAAALILKDQGIFLFLLLPLLILLRVKGRVFNLLAAFLAILPLIFLSVNFSGLTYFGFPRSSVARVLLLGAPIVYLAIRGFISEGKAELRQVVTPSIISAALGIGGILWIVRNILLYNHPVLPLGGPFTGFYEATGRIGTVTPPVHFEAKEFQLLFLPVFGTLLLLPKIFGILASFFEKKLFSVGLWFFAWYAVVVLYFGQANERYLAIVMPILAVLIAWGILVLQRWLENLNRKKLTDFLPVSAILFGIAFLTQSAFLSWNFGQTLFPTLSARKMLFEEPPSVSLTTATVDFREFLVSLARILNVRPALYSGQDVIGLILIGIIGSIIILLAGWAVVRLDFKKYALLLVLTLVAVFSLPYIFVIWQVSEGEIFSFAQKEENKVYSYWGESTYIVPYLRERARPDSVVLVYGPQTGLAYKTGLRVWNLKFGYALKELTPIIFERDEEKIYQFFKKNNVDFVLLEAQEDAGVQFNQLKQKTRVFDILENPKYFTLVVEPNSQNAWALYQINQINSI